MTWQNPDTESNLSLLYITPSLVRTSSSLPIPAPDTSTASSTHHADVEELFIPATSCGRVCHVEEPQEHGPGDEVGQIAGVGVWTRGKVWS